VKNRGPRSKNITVSDSHDEDANLRRVLENVSDGVCLLDENLCYQLFNARFIELIGLEQGDIQIGDSVNDVTRKLASRGFYGDRDEDEVSRERIAAFTADTTSEWELYTGGGRTVRVRCNPIADGGATITLSDITPRKTAEAAIQIKEHQLHQALDNIEGAVLMYDADLMLQVYSKRYLEIGDLPEDLFVIGQSIMPVLLFRAERGDYGEGDPVELAGERARFLQNIEQDFYHEQPMSGRICEVYWTRDSENNLVSVTNDITERKVTEMLLKLAKDEAHAASIAKTDFLANMSHELRTPLNAVIGFSEALKAGIAGPLNDKQSSYVSDIRVSGEHLLSLISDVLDLARIESGKHKIEESQFDLVEVINNTLPFVRERAQKSGTELIVDLPDELPMIRADLRLIKQMIVNLLSNAVKFTPDGGRVSVSASASTLQGIVISIADNGIGMGTDEIPKALSPFERTKSGQGKEGTGLGLSLVKNMCEMHGGSLSLSSKLGSGTTATITLPGTRIVHSIH